MAEESSNRPKTPPQADPSGSTDLDCRQTEPAPQDKAGGLDEGPSVSQGQPEVDAPAALPRRRPRRGKLPGRAGPSEPVERRGEPPPELSHEPAEFSNEPLEPSGPPVPGLATKRWPRARILKLAGISVAAAIVAGICAVVFLFWYYSRDLPSVAELKAGYDPPQVTRILARDKTLLASVFTERRTLVDFATVPDATKLAFLAAEDASFYEHEGLDYTGIIRALWHNLRSGRTRQGGSTITQQVVKNVLLDARRTYRRKIRETLLARRLEQYLSKDEIFSLYLNHIYLGHGRYGIEEAARYYFGKPASGLTLDESALLAGLVAAPERYSPRRARDRALARRTYVLDQMVEKRFVTPELAKSAYRAPLRLAPAVDAESELAPEIVAIAKETLATLQSGTRATHGLIVHTTIDPALQAAARSAVRNNLNAYARRQKLTAPFTATKRKLWGTEFQGKPRIHGIYVGRVVAFDDTGGTIDVNVGQIVGQVDLKADERYNPERLPPSKFTEKGAALRVRLLDDPEPEHKPRLRLELGPQSALVAIDVRSREVLALVGSYEALVGGLDRATQARRQPGSTFKPFVYSYALHSRRFTPATMIELERPVHGETHKRMSMRQALAHSVNEAAVKILRQSGPANVVEWAHALGIHSKLEPNDSLALGAYEVTPLELTNAFASFPSGGVYVPPRFIDRVMRRNGEALQLPAAAPARDVMTRAEAYLTTSLLQSVVREGTGRRARRLKRPLAGKTGTTNLKRGDRRTKDCWFVGYSTDIVAAVWVGYDDAIALGYGEAGSVTALPAWIEFMQAAHKGRPATEFPEPAGIETVSIDPHSGRLAYPGQDDAIEELFLEGSVPELVARPDAGTQQQVVDAGSASPLEAIGTQVSPSGATHINNAVHPSPTPDNGPSETGDYSDPVGPLHPTGSGGAEEQPPDESEFAPPF